MAKIFRISLVFIVFLGGCNWFESDSYSGDASLADLSLSVGVLDPLFSPSAYTYSVTVNPGTDSVIVTATPSHAAATVAVNDVPVTPANPDITVALGVGSTEITVMVMAEDRTSQQTYTIDVTRAAVNYSVGGTISGLTGTLALQNNGADDLDVSANGTFTFASAIADASAYVVTVSGQPAGQSCSVNNGNGTIAGANVTNINVVCVTPMFSVGGTISGLTGTVTLQNNGADDLDVSANGTFTFATSVADAAAYNVTVSGQPAGQTCSVSNGGGAISGSNVTTVGVSCVDNSAGALADWEWANPLPQGNTIMDAVWDSNQFVIVGTFGTVRTSPDGLTWTTRDAGTGSNLNGIAWNGSQFIAVGGYGTVVSSPDGVAWTAQSIGSTYTLYSVVWDGSQFVAVGQEEANDFGGAIATSPDGVTWAVQNFSLAGAYAWNDIAWNGSQFAAVQSPGFIHTSDDAVTWTTTDLRVAGTDIRSITSDGNQFVAAGFGVVYTSPDGVAWTLQNGGSRVQGFDITWDGSQFLAVGFTSIFRSPDGATWQEQYLDFPRNGFVSVAASGSRFVITGSNGLVLDSPDAATWTSQTTGEFRGLTDIIWNASLFVAVGHDHTIRTSPDGMAWTTQFGIDSTAPLYGIAWGGGQFVAVGSGSSDQVITSPDGITWTARTPINSSLALNSVAWDGNQFVAVGESGAIMSSPDGITWTAQTNGILATDSFQDVSWNGSLFVAVGKQQIDPWDNIVVTSPDGINWTAQVLPWWAYVESLTWNGSQFIVVGSRAILSSADGLSWTTQRDTNDGLRNVTWTGSQFVAVGERPTIFTSPDGVTWSGQRSVSGFYSAIASDGSKVVVVDQSGHILINSAL